MIPNVKATLACLMAVASAANFEPKAAPGRREGKPKNKKRGAQKARREARKRQR